MSPMSVDGRILRTSTGDLGRHPAACPIATVPGWWPEPIRPHRRPFLTTRPTTAMYSHPRVVEDALRAYAAGPGGVLGQQTLAALDFSTLRKLPAEWVTADFRRRHGDQVWCIRWRGRARGEDTVADSVLILLEFQSREDPDMALRINGYTLDLYRDLEAQR